MVFQSERQTDNPFYQIYLMDLATGDTMRISNGAGKTSCAWIHPSGDKVLFASTHEDPKAAEKQQQELDKRASGQGSRYSWSFDKHYELYEADTTDHLLRRLTNAQGYDAEGSWSPDGSTIVYASNRHAYEPGALSEEEKSVFTKDPSVFMDLYSMDADGGTVRRLTTTPGYDGGPFFSADGSRIVWRRFEPNGHVAEIWTMNPDGSHQRQVTRMGVMSWAPYFHPSGDYIIFANNANGYGNFELYIVDTAGQRAPVRVTDSEGFDGLTVFTPDGGRLAWASGRTPDKKAQIFIAEWDLGSSHFVKSFAAKNAPTGLEQRVTAYLNLNMVGRLDKQLYIQGVGSSSIWRGELEHRNAPIGLPLRLQDDSYLSTDTTSFYLAGIPVLTVFTGAHADYNTPRDTADALNYPGL